MVVTVDPARVNSARMLIEETLIRRGKVPLLYANAAWSILASPELDGYLVLHDVFFVVTGGVGLLVLINLRLPCLLFSSAAADSPSRRHHGRPAHLYKQSQI